jgi:ATP-dependent protease ClpP protease subunit
MSAEEAKEYGIIDQIITTRGALVEPTKLEAVTK